MTLAVPSVKRSTRLRPAQLPHGPIWLAPWWARAV